MDTIAGTDTTPLMGSQVSVEPMKYGGLIRRFIALILDAILLTVIMFIPTVLLVLLSLGVLFTDYYNLYYYLDPIIMILYAVATWLYFSWFESSSNMATPGKMVMGLKVADVNGNRITFKRAFFRVFLKFIFADLINFIWPILASLYVFGDVLTRFTNNQKRCLHDILAGTVVVHGYDGIKSK